MISISSHCLFHYTHTEGNLKSILEKGLMYSCIGEKIPGTHVMYLANAICFCDIPLSQISEHVSWYGPYAIGFKPQFVKSNGGTPVCYVHSASSFIKPKSKSTDRIKYFEQFPITPFLKQNYGKQRRYQCRKASFKNFYDEKEWRIVESNRWLVFPFTNLQDKRQIVSDAKIGVKRQYLTFTPEMIDFIILKERTEVVPFLNWLKSKSLVLNPETVVISMDMIDNNF